MGKLVAFSLSDEVVVNGGLDVAYMGRFGAIWVTTACLEDAANILMVHNPSGEDDIDRFNYEVEQVIARIRQELNQQ
jgi:hypothetical protein